jgi:hypothetical protein
MYSVNCMTRRQGFMLQNDCTFVETRLPLEFNVYIHSERMLTGVCCVLFRISDDEQNPEIQ